MRRMKRIISTLLSLSLVLSLLPAVALAEGEEATKWLEIPGNSEVLVDESELLYAIDETDNVAEETVTWTSADDSIVKVETATDDDLTNWGADPNEIKNRSAFVKITGLKVGTTTVTASTETRKALQDCTVTVTAPVPVTSVKLDQDELTCDSFEGLYYLNCTVYPDGASNTNVEWASSNPEVVQVYSSGDRRGQVVPQNPGIATITVSAQENPALTYDCIVTVTATRPVESISLNHDAKTFTKAGETLQLTATIYPDSATNKTVTWKSSDKTVATVDESGLVTAVGNGTANITATTEDGNYTATCKVTVEIPELTLSLDKTELTLTQTEEQQKLTATVSDTEEKVTWLSSDPFVATVTRDGTVTAIANGTATITASAGDKTVSCTVEVALTDTPAHTHVWSKSWDANVFYHYRRCQNRETCNFTSLEKQAGFNSHTFVNGKCSVCGRGQDNSKVQFGKVELIQTQFAYTGKEIEFVDRNNVRATLADGTTQDIPLSFRTRNLCKDGIPVNKCLEPGTYTAEVTAFTGLYEGTINVTITVVAPTHAHQYSGKWTSDATNHWHECECGEKSDLSAHQFQWVIDWEATATKTGRKHQECTICGYQTAPVTIPKKSAPTITVKDSTITVSNKSQTTKLDVKADKDAKLTYKSDNKSVKVDKNGKVTIAKNFVGKATITVTATSGGAKTTQKVTITVNPKGTTFRAVYNGKGRKLKAYWNRNSQVDGYQLQYGTSKNFTGCKTVTLKSNQCTGSVRTGLKKNATYYVRIRTYKRVSGKTYYSNWSKVKSFKVVR